MPLTHYGILKGRVVGFDAERVDRVSPHLQIFIEANGVRFRAAVNVKSRQAPSEVVYCESLDYDHPLLALYPDFPPGFTELACENGSGALDYIRSNLFDFQKVTALPHDLPGRDNDLLDKLEVQLERAIQLADDTDIYALGEPFPSGIHDVHMNQGSIGRFSSSNGVWQDGALFLHDHRFNRWTALFLAFQSQALHTDDTTGHALPGSPTFEDVVQGTIPGRIPVPPPEPVPIPPDGAVRIVAALVNPVGADIGESVTLLNAGAVDLQLAGWIIAASRSSRMVLPPTVLPAGGTTQVMASDTLRLSNQGGTISLLAPNGVKVHGVKYTRKQARIEGLTLTF